MLGVDVGGVIISRADDGSDTSFFGDNYLHSHAVPGALEGLGRLGRERFGDRVYVVSKCGATVERKTREWMEEHDFHATTGIDPDHLCFVRTREDKAPACAALGISHFIDDHADVLEVVSTVPHRILFTGGGPPGWRPDEPPQGVQVATTWDQVLSLLLTEPQLGEEAAPGAGVNDSTSDGRRA